MYSNIVVGTDGSEPAWRAVTHAADLAKLSGATLHVVRGVPHMVMADAATGAAAYAAMDGVVKDAEAHLVAQCEAIQHDKVQTHVVEAHGADALMDVCAEVDADLVVVGSRGMTGAKRFVLGSVPNAVSHHAPCSVLIVKTD